VQSFDIGLDKQTAGKVFSVPTGSASMVSVGRGVH